jgi:heat shock protein HtpX
MRELDASKLRNPLGLLLTIVIMIVGAALGVLIGQAFAANAAIGMAMLAGPIGALMAIPLAVLQVILVTSGLLLIVPVWALLGGWWFADRARWVSERVMNVEFLPETHPIHRRVNELAQQLNLPPAKWVGWFPGTEINAFARGVRPSETVIAFSKGAIDDLTQEQLDAVMAHELAHVANSDMARMSYAIGVQDALTWFLVFRGLKRFVRWVFTPTSQLELMRLSRQREYWADAIAAALVEKEHMIEALWAIRRGANEVKTAPKQPAQFMLHHGIDGLFSTHPRLGDRIAALEAERYINQLPYRSTTFSAADETANRDQLAACQSDAPVLLADVTPEPHQGNRKSAAANGVMSFGA